MNKQYFYSAIIGLVAIGVINVAFSNYKKEEPKEEPKEDLTPPMSKEDKIKYSLLIGGGVLLMGGAVAIMFLKDSK